MSLNPYWKPTDLAKIARALLALLLFGGNVATSVVEHLEGAVRGDSCRAMKYRKKGEHVQINRESSKIEETV